MAKATRQKIDKRQESPTSPLGLPRASEVSSLSAEIEKIQKKEYDSGLGLKGDNSPPLKEFLSDFKPEEFLSFVAKNASPEDQRDLAEAIQKLKPDLFDAFEGASSDQLETKNGVENLPSVAPKLWTDREKAQEHSPAAFIRKHYAKWIGNGLTNGLLQKLDLALYTAYRREVAKEAKVMIPSLPLTTRTKQLSPADARERQLESKRKYYHRNKGL